MNESENQLTNVQMWDPEKGFIPVTLEEAVEKYPYTVSANSGIFLCGYCHQFITLTNSRKISRYFKHSRGYDDKDCIERSFNDSQGGLWTNPYCYNKKPQYLPIKIKFNEGKKEFSLSIGFFPIPLNDLSGYIDIYTANSRGEKKENIATYSFDRIDSESSKIVYLNIGMNPARKYRLVLKSNQPRVSFFWPSEIDGIFPYTLFDKESRKRLPPDGNVFVGKEYYLLVAPTCEFDKFQNAAVSCKKIFTSKPDGYRIYLVRAKRFTAYVAKFFMQLGFELRKKRVKLTPIWPISIQRHYVLYHENPTLYFHISDNDIDVGIYSSSGKARGLSKTAQSGSCIKVKNERKDKSQLISSGKSSMMTYLYLWNGMPEMKESSSQILVTDESGNEVSSGVYRTLPEALRFSGNCFNVKMRYYRGDILRWVKEIKVNESFSIPSSHEKICFGDRIEIIQGLDLIYRVKFARPKPKLKVNSQSTVWDMVFVRTIQSYHGDEIPVPYEMRSWGAVLPVQLRNWLRMRIQTGEISLRAYRSLKSYIVNKMRRKSE